MNASLGAAGRAYLVRPGDDEPGPALMVLHSRSGLDQATKARCNDFADEGFAVIAPDLFGEVPSGIQEGHRLLNEMDPNAAVALIMSSVVAVRSVATDASAPISVVGFSMGASLAWWLATRQPDSVAAVVGYYGTQLGSFAAMKARACCHFGDDDQELGDDVLLMETEMFEARVEPLIWNYPGVGHSFAELGSEGYDAAAASLAWSRTLDFLHSIHNSPV
jgi:carboxymethylenebutenolidase